MATNDDTLVAVAMNRSSDVGPLPDTEFLRLSATEYEDGRFLTMWTAIRNNAAIVLTTSVIAWMGYTGDARHQRCTVRRHLDDYGIRYQKITAADVTYYPDIIPDMEEAGRHKDERHWYVLNILQFKHLVMSIRTNMGDTVRRYYTDLEEKIRLYGEYLRQHASRAAQLTQMQHAKTLKDRDDQIAEQLRIIDEQQALTAALPKWNRERETLRLMVVPNSINVETRRSVGETIIPLKRRCDSVNAAVAEIKRQFPRAYKLQGITDSPNALYAWKFTCEYLTRERKLKKQLITSSSKHAARRVGWTLRGGLTVTRLSQLVADDNVGKIVEEDPLQQRIDTFFFTTNAAVGETDDIDDDADDSSIESIDGSVHSSDGDFIDDGDEDVDEDGGANEDDQKQSIADSLFK